jgi:hypothetical protein
VILVPIIVSANLAGTDTITSGNWQGVYGADGYALANVTTQEIPGYATFQVQGQTNWTWAANTTDLRALRIPGGGGGIAAAWYNDSTFNFDVNFKDGNLHQFALYALDWDSKGRVETIQILDANTNNQLDSRTISSFSSGTYVVWDISGHVKINVTAVSGPNAVVSGVFFGSASQSGATITSANSTTFTVGQPGTFTVKSSGTPTPSLTENGTLPAGVSLLITGMARELSVEPRVPVQTKPTTSALRPRTASRVRRRRSR